MYTAVSSAPKSSRSQGKSGPPLAQYARYSTAGIQVVAFVVICVLLGRQLDSWLETSKPWFTMVFALLGSVGGIIQIIVRFTDVFQHKSRQPPNGDTSTSGSESQGTDSARDSPAS